MTPNSRRSIASEKALAALFASMGEVRGRLELQLASSPGGNKKYRSGGQFVG